MFREIAEKEVKPLAAVIDEEQRFPAESIPVLAEMGVMGINVPAQYGGSEAGNLALILAVEEISAYCASTGVIVAVHNALCIGAIMMFGTEEQKEKYLPALASGEMLGAFSLTEAGAGTAAGMLQMKAEENADAFILNGSKIFVTNGGEADLYIVFAVTDKTQGKNGISAFIAEKDSKGFSAGAHEKKMGIRGSVTAEISFDNCAISKGNLLGDLGKGHKIALAVLDGGRVALAAQALGIAQGAINETVEYVKTREQFGQPLSSFQNTRFELADMNTKVEAARLLIYRAACAMDSGENYRDMASMAKLFASEVAADVTRRCLQLFGGYGYTCDFPIERMMRDAKITEIYGGTSEAQKMIISAHMGVK